jgi:DNA-binding SARP family transcriptional activator
MELKLFGSPRVEGLLESIPLERPAWLCLYLVMRGDWVTRDELACLFRPETDDVTALSALRLILHRAKKFLWAANLEIEAKRVRLLLPCDVQRFEILCANQNWLEALEIYQADFLAGFEAPTGTDLPAWLELERLRLRHLWTDAVLQRVTILENSADYGVAIGWLERLLILEPLTENAVQALLRCLLKRGQRTEAILVFERFAALLQLEFNLLPEAATKAILEPNPEVMPVLPSSLLPLLGRETELGQLKTWLLGTNRLVCIVGIGGSGKTRLALETARLLRPDFVHGTVFIDGTALTTSQQFPQALVSALGVSAGASLEAALTTFLHDKAVLLLLDNFEHLTATRKIIHDLLEAAPNLRVLLTSRVRLGSSFETVLDLSGLAVSDSLLPEQIKSNAAVCLFIQTAQRLSSFVPNLGLVAQIVQQLEGLPLAVELAARWTRILSLEQILIELEKSQTWLETDVEDIPERHRSLNAVLSSTWGQLSKRETKALEALSVFRGGATLEGIRFVGQTQLPTLLALVNQGLLRRDTNGRFSSHEMIREFAALQSSQSQLEQYHAAFFANQSQIWETAKRQASTLTSMDSEKGNIHLAWAYWAIYDHAALEQTIELLADYWEVRGLYHQALNYLGAYTATRGTTLEAQTNFWKGLFKRLTNDFTTALECLELAATQLELLNFPLKTSRAYLNMAYIGFEQARYADAKALLHRAKTNSDLGIKAECSNLLGAIARREQQYEQALEYYHQARELHQKTSNLPGLGAVLNNIANILELQNNNQAAYQHYVQCLEIFIKIGHQRPIAVMHSNLGFLATKLGHFLEAKNHLETSLTLRRKIGDQIGQITVLTNLAQLGLTSQDTGLVKQALSELFPLAIRLEASAKALEAYLILAEWCIWQGLPQATSILRTIIEDSRTPEQTKALAQQKLTMSDTGQALPLEQWQLVFQ